MSSAASFRAAVESWDIDAVRELLAPDIVFHSPVMFEPFVGREQVTQVLSMVAQTFEDFRYTDELESDSAHALIFTARVGDKELQGVDLIRLDEQGLVTDFTVMLRPLTGLIPFAEAMGAKLAASGMQPPGG
ncbi:MAG TPA: nuclear transport factor 2 family protein [Solirubrobacteraceae bacterium]|nr:nuclear transport factor 2 family protein [Solirubrobacteraceae bacterium]